MSSKNFKPNLTMQNQLATTTSNSGNSNTPWQKQQEQQQQQAFPVASRLPTASPKLRLHSTAASSNYVVNSNTNTNTNTAAVVVSTIRPSTTMPQIRYTRQDIQEQYSQPASRTKQTSSNKQRSLKQLNSNNNSAINIEGQHKNSHKNSNNTLTSTSPSTTGGAQRASLRLQTKEGELVKKGKKRSRSAQIFSHCFALDSQSSLNSGIGSSKTISNNNNNNNNNSDDYYFDENENELVNNNNTSNSNTKQRTTTQKFNASGFNSVIAEKRRKLLAHLGLRKSSSSSVKRKQPPSSVSMSAIADKQRTINNNNSNNNNNSPSIRSSKTTENLQRLSDSQSQQQQQHHHQQPQRACASSLSSISAQRKHVSFENEQPARQLPNILATAGADMKQPAPFCLNQQPAMQIQQLYANAPPTVFAYSSTFSGRLSPSICLVESGNNNKLAATTCNTTTTANTSTKCAPSSTSLQAAASKSPISWSVSPTNCALLARQSKLGYGAASLVDASPIYKQLPPLPMRTQATQTDITAYHLMAAIPHSLSNSNSNLSNCVATTSTTTTTNYSLQNSAIVQTQTQAQTIATTTTTTTSTSPSTTTTTNANNYCNEDEDYDVDDAERQHSFKPKRQLSNNNNNNSYKQTLTSFGTPTSSPTPTNTDQTTTIDDTLDDQLTASTREHHSNTIQRLNDASNNDSQTCVLGVEATLKLQRNDDDDDVKKQQQEGKYGKFDACSSKFARSSPTSSLSRASSDSSSKSLEAHDAVISGAQLVKLRKGGAFKVAAKKPAHKKRLEKRAQDNDNNNDDDVAQESKLAERRQLELDSCLHVEPPIEFSSSACSQQQQEAHNATNIKNSATTTTSTITSITQVNENELNKDKSHETQTTTKTTQEAAAAETEAKATTVTTSEQIARLDELTSDNEDERAQSPPSLSEASSQTAPNVELADKLAVIGKALASAAANLEAPRTVLESSSYSCKSNADVDSNNVDGEQTVNPTFNIHKQQQHLQQLLLLDKLEKQKQTQVNAERQRSQQQFKRTSSDARQSATESSIASSVKQRFEQRKSIGGNQDASSLQGNVSKLHEFKLPMNEIDTNINVESSDLKQQAQELSNSSNNLNSNSSSFNSSIEQRRNEFLQMPDDNSQLSDKQRNACARALAGSIDCSELETRRRESSNDVTTDDNELSEDAAVCKSRTSTSTLSTRHHSYCSNSELATTNLVGDASSNNNDNNNGQLELLHTDTDVNLNESLLSSVKSGLEDAQIKASSREVSGVDEVSEIGEEQKETTKLEQQTHQSDNSQQSSDFVLLAASTNKTSNDDKDNNNDNDNDCCKLTERANSDDNEPPSCNKDNAAHFDDDDDDDERAVKSNFVDDDEARIESATQTPTPTTVSELSQDETLSTPSFVDSYRKRYDCVCEFADKLADELLRQCVLTASCEAVAIHESTTENENQCGLVAQDDDKNNDDDGDDDDKSNHNASSNKCCRQAVKPKPLEKPQHLRGFKQSAQVNQAHSKQQQRQQQTSAAAVTITATTIAAAAAARSLETNDDKQEEQEQQQQLQLLNKRENEDEEEQETLQDQQTQQPIANSTQIECCANIELKSPTTSLPNNADSATGVHASNLPHLKCNANETNADTEEQHKGSASETQPTTTTTTTTTASTDELSDAETVIDATTRGRKLSTQSATNNTVDDDDDDDDDDDHVDDFGPEIDGSTQDLSASKSLLVNEAEICKLLPQDSSKTALKIDAEECGTKSDTNTTNTSSSSSSSSSSTRVSSARSRGAALCEPDELIASSSLVVRAESEVLNSSKIKVNEENALTKQATCKQFVEQRSAATNSSLTTFEMSNVVNEISALESAALTSALPVKQTSLVSGGKSLTHDDTLDAIDDQAIENDGDVCVLDVANSSSSSSLSSFAIPRSTTATTANMFSFEAQPNHQHQHHHHQIASTSFARSDSLSTPTAVKIPNVETIEEVSDEGEESSISVSQHGVVVMPISGQKGLPQVLSQQASGESTEIEVDDDDEDDDCEDNNQLATPTSLTPTQKSPTAASAVASAIAPTSEQKLLVNQTSECKDVKASNSICDNQQQIAHSSLSTDSNVDPVLAHLSKSHPQPSTETDDECLQATTTTTTIKSDEKNSFVAEQNVDELKQQQQQRRRPPLKELRSACNSNNAKNNTSNDNNNKQQQQQQQTAATNTSSICSSCSCQGDSFEQQQQQQQPTELKKPSQADNDESAKGSSVSTMQRQPQRQLAPMQSEQSLDEGSVFTQNYWLSRWLYVSEFEEAEIWRRAIEMEPQRLESNVKISDGNKRASSVNANNKVTRNNDNNYGDKDDNNNNEDNDDDDDIEDDDYEDDAESDSKSTTSEASFSKFFKSATRKMIHRRATIEMCKRLMENTLKAEKRVEISKSNGEFGFRIHGSRPVVVSAIERGTSAETCGLQVGDLLFAINGIKTLEASHNDVVRLAHNAKSSALVLDLTPTNDFLRTRKPTDEARSARVLSASLKRLSASTAQPMLLRLQRKSARLVDGVSPTPSVKLTMRKAWRKRFFLLRADNCLYWYRTSYDVVPLGGINLQGFSATVSNEFNEPKYIIKLVKHGNKPNYLSTSSRHEMQTWIDALNKAAIEANQNDAYVKHTLSIARNPPNAVPNPECVGYLHKLSKRKSGQVCWKSAFFVLKHACLYMFRQTEVDLNDESNGKQVISAEQASNASAVYFLHGYKVRGIHIEHESHTFELSPPNRKTIKPIYLKASSEVEKKKFVS